MSPLSEVLSAHTSELEHQRPSVDRVIVLVQSDLVISIFPENQFTAALDLARVICRALALPVDVFWLRRDVAEQVCAGDVATAKDPAWTHLAHVHASLLTGVEIEICDPEMRHLVDV